ncbi:evolutionary conserved C-terminal 3 [Arabidopsis lyrata subsp. lyrata]|uniref:YTH domain-containing family protein n=1 Tax=Arabidopsis lyrata subsp. lyrata TaxID=81972 RepID=D7MUG7_ARALL|nr:evolutionary conserved C-terminal 3 [Arabidopsis lyrata subsp. lyrata]
MANPDHVSDVLHNLSIDPATKVLAPDSETKLQGAFGGNGNDFLLNGDLVEATKNGKPSLLSKDGGLTKDKGSNLKKLGYQSSAYNAKGSYGKGAYSYGYYSPAYQFPRYGYSGSYASGKTNLQYQYLTQNGRSAGTGQSYGGYMDNIYSNYGVCGPYTNGYGYGSFGYDSWKYMPNWYAVNNTYKTRNGFHGYGKENIEGLNELNRGPRAKGFSSQDGSKVMTVSSKEQRVTETENLSEDVSLLDPKDYNKIDFPETYSEAKFFVIKSYSEDDIHKSIKYSVWSSTPNGNKKLDASYNEAKQKLDGCPVFLLFSVNTSGQFVGLAEMVGPVDFNKTVEYWQQDKWIGCFPVKWHFVKDIPNSSLRHITLENNENKPVTNSRDTQEVKLEQGVKVIKIFKDHASKTCILDDFVFYENRQKIIQERKSKHLQIKKQTLVANTDKRDSSVMPKINIVKPQESTTASEDTAALGVATEVTRESKVVKENELPVEKTAVATAC